MEARVSMLLGEQVLSESGVWAPHYGGQGFHASWGTGIV